VPTVRQVCATSAALVGGGAGGTLVVVAADTPGLRLRGSVSQLGAVGEPHAGAYQVAIFAIVAAVGLLAVALRPVSLPAALLLTGTSAFGGVSATVACTPGCPLPPDPTATAADVVHVAASIAAFVAVAAAMVLLARRAPQPLARACRYSVMLIVLLGTPVGIALLLTGEGIVNGVLERAMMAVALAWQIGAAVLAPRPDAVLPPTGTSPPAARAIPPEIDASRPAVGAIPPSENAIRPAD
jgi:hypothetical protein